MIFSSESPHKQALQISHDEFKKREDRIHTSCRAAFDFKCSRSWQCSNRILATLYEWMEGSLMLNWLWIHGFEVSPLMLFELKLLKMARIHLDLARSLLYDDVRWRIKQELCNCYEEMREKNERKLRAKILGMNLWSVVTEFLLGFGLNTPY
jgi:hypothetical protein